MRHLNRSSRHPIGLLGGFSLVLGGLVAVILLIFWLFLADYQQNLPQNFAEQILTAYQSGDVAAIKQYAVNLPEPLENPALFKRYYQEQTDLTKLYFYPGSSQDPTESCYEFAAGTDRIATLTLQKTGVTSRFGFPQYEIESITGYPLITYKITAPADTALFINGKLLSERYRTGKELQTDCFSAVTSAVFQTKTYEITDFSYVDELDVFSADGCDYTVTWSADHHTATVEKQISKEEQAELSDFAIQFSEAYSVFATKQNGARDPVLRLLQPNTPFYRALLLYHNDWGERYTHDRYDNRTVDHFIRYSPTEFSCDIRFDYVIQLPDGFEKAYPYHMTYYLTRQNGRLLLVDMQAKSS